MSSATDTKTSGQPSRTRPWIFRTYAGHSSAKASNELFRTNLSRGQTGLSIAFDLPTQTGFDSDHPLALGETGKVGVPVCHLDDMSVLFEELPLERMNTSMTINATAAWLLSLYIAVGDRQGADRKKLQGTVQNDIIKEYLSRGTYVFGPKPSLKLITDIIEFTTREIPKWNPTNICSYHLQEAGATPVQELAFALATGVGVLDELKMNTDFSKAEFNLSVGRISFFVNAGIRFITELCKMRAFAELWEEITRERYGVDDPRMRRFRYGVQVNSLGLTEQQPENNPYRILIEMLAVTLSKNARARAVQLPAWNEALGLPRPWDQQWSLRMQQILALETDLLEYDDIFDGSPVIDSKVRSLKKEALEELERIEAMGGVIQAVEQGYMKSQLVLSNTERTRQIANGDIPVVGVNCYQETAPSPLTESNPIMSADPKAVGEQIARLNAFREQRDKKAVEAMLLKLKTAVSEGANIMPVSIECAKAGVTTGEWTAVLKEVFGEYRAPTGLSASVSANHDDSFADARQAVEDASEKLGRRVKLLVGKPGLDGHSNGAEQIAVAARDSGMEVVYEGIRLSPRRLIDAASDESVHVIGISVLSGSHMTLVEEILKLRQEEDLNHIPLVVGGIIPNEDADRLYEIGVARVYTPKDFDLVKIMTDIAGLAAG